MRVAVSGQDDFVQPHLEAALGDDLLRITSGALEDPRTLDALLTSCDAIVLMNAHPPKASGRDDRKALLEMRTAGASRIGASRTVEILDECRRRVAAGETD